MLCDSTEAFIDEIVKCVLGEEEQFDEIRSQSFSEFELGISTFKATVGFR